MIISKRRIVAAFLAFATIDAFSPRALQSRNNGLVVVNGNCPFNGGVLLAKLSDDCGCQTEFSGKPPVTAQTLNHREAVREHRIYNLDGETVAMDQLIGEPTMNQISVVVFLRSLG